MVKPTVAIKSKTPTLLEEFERLHEQIASRAFEFFIDRGGAFGKELEDWVRAEQEMVLLPPIEIAEAGNNFSVRVALPGFKEDDIEVFADARSVTVKAERKEESRTEEKKVQYSEFRTGKVLRQFELPSEIVPDKAKAELQEGILFLTLAKAEAAAKKKIEVESASNRAA